MRGAGGFLEDSWTATNAPICSILAAYTAKDSEKCKDELIRAQKHERGGAATAHRDSGQPPRHRLLQALTPLPILAVTALAVSAVAVQVHHPLTIAVLTV